MFKIVISQQNLKSIIDAVSHLVSEAKMIILEDGIKIDAVDPANVAMVFLHAGQGAFEYFHADKCELALDLAKLASLTAGKDSVSLELDEETHKLKIVVGRAKYKMSLLDPSAIKNGPRLPQMDMPAHIAIPGTDLQEAVKAAAKVSDHVILVQDDQNFTISAKGNIDAFEMPFALTESQGVKMGESRALFSLDYIEDIAKVASRADLATIETGIDYPMRITFNLGESINICYLLAPRIEQD
ncbi:DNA polymerase sliding clamp [Candidatus Pacearchaeota archaeon]|jgi:proliferating cell nuclear antigen|nr:DNA polymerase sliding clamp [Candidatus Pacearchaeota archaeon]